MTLCPLDLKVDPLTIGSPPPVDLTLIKTHSKVDGSDLDSLITSWYLPEAILQGENHLRRTIFSRSHRWVLKDFPRWGRQEIRLPRGKCTAVASIVYYNNGSTTTLTGPTSGSPAGTDWREDLNSEDGGVLMPPAGEDWPSVDDDHPSPVVITFTAGWADVDVPQDIQKWLAFSIADAVEIGNTQDVDFVKSLERRLGLVSGYALHRWY